MSSFDVAAVIVAGGRGARARTGQPKQYAQLGGVPLLRRTIDAFRNHAAITRVLVVIGREDRDLYETAVAGLDGLLPPATGGETRQASVRAGLEALAETPPDAVLVHDGARPFVRAATIDAIVEQLHSACGAIAALPVADTLKRESSAGGIAETVPRQGLWRAQTPQGFRFDTILAAHRKAGDQEATDDAALLERDGVHVVLVPDHPTNIKLTYREDFDLAEQLLAGARETRTGSGYDVHAFEPGDAVTLCGVDIAHEAGLKGHSDADVGLHALADAIYGALGEGDIGVHFPPSDPQWKGAPSRTFVEHAAARVKERRGRIVNVDVTLICEAPKIAPHREAMTAAMAEMLGLRPAAVSIKATTTEGLGFTGRREGIAAQAIVSIELPRS
jgi:2-C-methyl-D-erythritol 4-phosphate cytidylyltransferase/2-C-methyl-D-erythritol 2,4-cyclodiphosphate synthase